MQQGNSNAAVSPLRPSMLRFSNGIGFDAPFLPRETQLARCHSTTERYGDEPHTARGAFIQMPVTNLHTSSVDTMDTAQELPALRFDIKESSRILRVSRAHLYKRIASGEIAIQKDGSRTYILLSELHRYVEACQQRGHFESAHVQAALDSAEAVSRERLSFSRRAD